MEPVLVLPLPVWAPLHEPEALQAVGLLVVLQLRVALLPVPMLVGDKAMVTTGATAPPPPAVTFTLVDIRPPTSKLPLALRPSSPPDDTVDTIIKANTAFPRRRVATVPRPQRTPSPSNPDDTIKMGDELAEKLQEARDRLTENAAPEAPKPRAPKAPR